ncbi:MAG: tRNA-dihydrouridine synthase [Parcubacteria group bacterium LiPW_15]|nr:MAG: tRNA-dihydrouridine synthase [Parcubacteria group bacterium LiPW_15]
MIQGFWKKLKRPVFALAPMADVTDEAFRRIVAKYGKPDVTWTEFVSADGLCSRGIDKLLPDLWFSESERPIVAQLFTSQPEHIKKAAALVQKLGFDGIDINLGCPDKSVEKQGAGAALIKDPKLAQKIILAAMKGAPKIPVSVKTRVGYNTEILDEWLPHLLKTKPAALTVHFRTRKEMSKVPARWELAEKVLKLRDKYSPQTLVLGNGDVKDMEDAKEKVKKYKVDGIMFGRAIFGTPWLMAKRSVKITEEKRLKILLEHTKLFEKLFGGINPHTYPNGKPKNTEFVGKRNNNAIGVGVKRFEVMKKHFKAYVSGFDGAKELRMELMGTKNAKEVEIIIKKHLSLTSDA